MTKEPTLRQRVRDDRLIARREAASAMLHALEAIVQNWERGDLAGAVHIGESAAAQARKAGIR